MANNYSGNPWTITAAGVTLTSKVRIKNLNWTNAAVGNTLLIQDNSGRDIVNDTWAAGSDHNYGELGWVAGFHVVTITGGEVSVTVGK